MTNDGSIERGTTRRTIGRQLRARVSLLSIIAVLGWIIATILGLWGTLQSAQRSLEEISAQSRQEFDDFLGSVQTDLQATGDALSAGAVPDEVIQRALERQFGIFELALIDPQGTVVTSRRRVGGAVQEFARQPWLDTVQRGDIYVGSVNYEQFGVPFVDIALPVVDEEGAFSSTLLASVDLTALWDTVVSLRVGETGRVFVTDANGELLIHPDLQLVLGGATFQELTDQAPQELVDAEFPTYSLAEGDQAVASVEPLSAVTWYAIAEQPMREALRPFFIQSAISLGLLLVGAGLVYSVIRFTRRRIADPLQILRTGVDALRQGELEHRITPRMQGEFGALAKTLNALAAQLQGTIGTLERRVAERTRGLQAAAEVSRATTSVLDPEELLRQVVDLVQERFDLYYVGLFLLDERNRFAKLRAGTGEAGQQMIADEHQLEVGGNSMIGQCVARDQARILLDVGEEAARFDNPLLPATRSEMALPLRSRGRVIGAMTVQSSEEAAFEDADVAVMQTMADQVAVAIDNAQLFAEAERALEEMKATQRRYLGTAWSDFVDTRPVVGYQQSEDRIHPITDAPSEDERDASNLVTPILLRDQMIGALGFKEANHAWSREEMALIETISEQFALAAETLRLLEETQRRAAREQLTREITEKMRRAVTVDRIVQTAVDELYQALGTSRTFVRLGTTPPQPGDGSDGPTSENGDDES
ncbi:MAG: GAF domain-containing protein [Anaerolineae bacterium]|jgi:GAF domain-containing protein/HAMP domain-containing protein